MTDQFRINNLENKVVIQDTKFEMFMQEMRDFKSEMRQQNEMRAAEIAATRAENAQNRAEINAQIADIRNETRNIGRYIFAMVVTVVVGVGAMFLNLFGLIGVNHNAVATPAQIPPQPPAQSTRAIIGNYPAQ